MAPKPTYSFAVFPFLKTSGRVRIGRFVFQSTDDLSGLSHEQVGQLAEIRSMLFWRDNLRLKNSTFAVVPFVDPDRPDAAVIDSLSAIQIAVGYLYGSPNELSGEPFLTIEHAALVILTPGNVHAALVNPVTHLEPVGECVAVPDSGPGFVPGYHGLYNFRDAFWVSHGSRLHGLLPQMTLNHTQDLHQDLHRLSDEFRRVVFATPRSTASERILVAMRWYNDCNAAMNDAAASIVDLAIAFETLLGIPSAEAKTERFADAIALLLGRTSRLDVWARQFYDARSSVAHEGRARQLRFVPSDSTKAPRNPQLHNSLLALGRQVFRLCARVLTLGTSLSQDVGLEEKLVTNRERFERLCKILGDASLSATEKLERIVPTAQAINDHKFISETGLAIDSVVGAAKLVAETLIAGTTDIPEQVLAALRVLANVARSENQIEALRAIEAVHEVVRNRTILPERQQPWAWGIQLLEDISFLTMLHLFHLERRLLAPNPQT